MRKIHAVPGWFAILSIVLSACGVASQPSPTATPEPSNTPLPTATFTRTPTATPRPTNTPTIAPTLAFGEPQMVAEGGYSFRPPVGYQVDVQGAQVGILDPAGTIILSVYGATSNPQNLSADAILDEFTAAVFKKGDGEYEKENPQTIQVDGMEGLSYDLTGTLFGSPLQGQAIIVMLDNKRFFYGLGVANTGRDPERWEDEGSKVFSDLIASISFSTAQPSQSAPACLVSTDHTYGFTLENPIKVGGDAFGGPARERAYLENLLGMNGEPIIYERAGSIPFEDTVLDAFEVTVAGQKVTLYIDEYDYMEPQAPVGFTCVGAFPLSEP